MTTNAQREPERRSDAGDRRVNQQDALAAGATPPARAAVRDAHEPYASLMRYKRWADEELFTTLLGRPDIEAQPQAAILREIVGHFHAVDRIFQAHLQGVTHAFTSTRLQDSLSLTQLQEEVLAVDRWYVDHSERVGSDTLRERLPIRFTDGSEKIFTRADVLLHVSHHGTYHRGNAGVLLRMMGMDLPADRFIDYVERLEPRG